MQTVVLYTRPACPLCDEARAELAQLARRWSFRVEEIDITSDWELYKRYHEQIPVITVGGQVSCFGRVDAAALSEALQAAP